MREKMITRNENKINRLPLELLEHLLLRTFVKLFTDHYKSQFNTRRVSVQRSYSALAAVCYNWWQTMNGWPQSPTGHWFKHQLHRCVKMVDAGLPFTISMREHNSFTAATASAVMGVIQCHNKLYIVSQNSDEIVVVDAKSVHKRFPSIRIVGLQQPNDMVACPETRQLYVADIADNGCIWRASTDGRQVQKWKSPESAELTTLLQDGMHRICWGLSVRYGRLLMTTGYCMFVHYTSDGNVLRKVSIDSCRRSDWDVEHLLAVQHAVETTHETFVVVLVAMSPAVNPRITEVDSDGCEIRYFSDPELLDEPLYIALDPSGRVFVVDDALDRLLLLTHRLELERIVVDVVCWSDGGRVKSEEPLCMCYAEHVGRLIVSASHSFCVYDIRPVSDSGNKLFAKKRRQECVIV